MRFWVRFNPVSEIVHEYKWVPMALIFIKFLTSYAADKCNDREAAANQTLPPLCNWLQVRFGDIRWTFLSPNKEKTLKGAGWGCEWGPRALNERLGVQTQHSYQLRSELPCSWSWTLIPPETQGARENRHMIFLNYIGALTEHKYSQSYSSVLLLPLSLSVRFICDNLALPVPCHWERINTDEPYQVSKITNIVGTSFQGLK